MLIRVMLCFLGKVEGVSRGIAVYYFERLLYWLPFIIFYVQIISYHMPIVHIFSRLLQLVSFEVSTLVTYIIVIQVNSGSG